MPNTLRGAPAWMTCAAGGKAGDAKRWLPGCRRHKGDGMASFGVYQTVRQLAGSGLASVWSARKDGESQPRYVVKNFRPFMPISEQQGQRDVTLFLQSAEAQRQVAAKGAAHWCANPRGPGHGGGGLLRHRRLQPIASATRPGPGQADRPDAGALAEAIVAGLIEIKTLSGRAHGNLKPTNVLLGQDADLSRAAIVLTDPLPQELLNGARSELADLRALGELIYQLVTFRPFKSVGGGPLASSDDWNRLGQGGEAWRTLCGRLLDPNLAAGAYTLDDVQRDLTGMKEAKRRLPVAWVAAAVLVLAAAGGGAWVWMHRGPAHDESKTPGVWKPEVAADWKVFCTNSQDWFVAFCNNFKNHRSNLQKVKDFEDIVSRMDKAPRAGNPLKPSTYCNNELPMPDSPPATISVKGIGEVQEAANLIRAIRDSVTNVANWTDEQAKAFHLNGWDREEGYLRDLVAHAEFKTGADIGHAMEDLANAREAVKDIQKRWDVLQECLIAMEASRDPVLIQVGGYLKSSASSQGSGGLGVLSDLKTKLDDASLDHAREIVKADFPDGIDETLFQKEAPVFTALSHEGKLNANLLKEWVEQEPGYRRLKPDPRDTWVATDAIAAIESKLLAYQAKAAEIKAINNDYDSLSAKLAEVKKKVTALEDRQALPSIERTREQITIQLASTGRPRRVWIAK